jgi:hypothetical protein
LDSYFYFGTINIFTDICLFPSPHPITLSLRRARTAAVAPILQGDGLWCAGGQVHRLRTPLFPSPCMERERGDGGVGVRRQEEMPILRYSTEVELLDKFAGFKEYGLIDRMQEQRMR